MKTFIKSLLIMLIGMGLISISAVQAQLYVGNTGLVYISSGEQLYINGSLDVISGGKITHNSTADITVTGVRSLNGIMEYTASGNQNILNDPHQSLYIGGSGNKILSSDITVGTNLQLGGTAKLVTGSYILSLTGGSSTITGTSAFGSTATSWIVTGNGSTGAGNAGLGGLKIEGIGATGRSGAVLYPIGPTTDSYNPLTITNTGTDDDFDVAVNDQSVPGSPALKSINNTWNISETTPGGSNVTLGSQWNTTDEAASFIRATCGIVHSDGTNIISYGASAAAAGSNPWSISGAGFTSFSPFGISSDPLVLPVSFLQINGYRKGAFIQVDWDVASETGIRYYEVQKSNSGLSFITADQVSPLNNNNQASYSWIDHHPDMGTNFYRIKSLDVAGTLKYSRTVKVQFNSNTAAINAYPNPVVNGNLSLEFVNKAAGSYYISLINLRGQVVFKKELRHNGSNGSYTLQLPTIVTGSVYQMRIIDGDGSSTTIKLMVK